jgi:hypothetical protein
MNEEPPEEPPEEAPYGCLFLSWIAIILLGASLVGVMLQKFFPFLFPQ